MATTVTLTMSDMIDQTLSELYRLSERPYQTTVGSNDLTASAADVTLTLGDGSNVNVSDILEVDAELLLVTGKTADATPVFTVTRRYAGTALAAHVEGSVVLKSPQFTRTQIKNRIERFFSGPAHTYLPSITSETMQREPDLQYIVMPATCVRVLSVRHFNTMTGRIIDVGTWRFEEDLPADVVPTGKALRLSTLISDDDDMIVTWQRTYAWSTTPITEASTIAAPLGTEDLPVLWASAYLTARREVTRLELDTVEEWNQEQATRLGVSLRQVRDLWGEFYRRVDEARKTQYVPRHRPYRKMPNLL